MAELFDEAGRPVCGDEYCPGFPDCHACDQLRFMDAKAAESGGEPAWYSAPLSRLCAPEGFVVRGTFGQRSGGDDV